MIVGFRGSDCRVPMSGNQDTRQLLDSWNQQHGSPLSGMSASSGEERPRGDGLRKIWAGAVITGHNPFIRLDLNDAGH